MKETAETGMSRTRSLAAACWLGAAFLALPLAFFRMGGGKVPFFGTAEFVTIPVLGIFSFALVLGFGDWTICRRDPRWRFLAVMQAAIALLTLWHWGRGLITWRGAAAAGFLILAPVAGAALKPELERMLPAAAALGAGLMLWSGLTSENFTGLTGNWNWTQALLAALLPGAFFRNGKWCLPLGIAAEVLIFGLIWWRYPAQLSRTVMIALPLAALLLWGRRKFRPRRPTVWLTAAFLFLAAAFLVTVFAMDWTDSRFQLWKGAADLALDCGLTGGGIGQFGNAVVAYLPEKYHFTPFAAVWHPHPHNELLHLLAAYGLAGGGFLLALVCAALGRRARDDRELLAQWVFLVLLICGQTDVVCSTVCGGVWLLTCAGVAAGPRRRRPAPVVWRRMLPAALLVLAAGALAINHLAARLDYWQAQLARIAGDAGSARLLLHAAAVREDDPAVLYDLAELELVYANAPGSASGCLETLAALRRENYLHTRRLRALYALKTGDTDTALTEMACEMRNHPLSVINARLYWRILQRTGRPPAEVATARMHLERLCRLRGVTLNEATYFSSAEDDRPLQLQLAAGD